MNNKFINLAINNIAKYGDTDIFPYPIEKMVFFDKQVEVAELIEKIHKGFHEYINKYPPFNINASIPLGYTGFRWATQIDPIWNAYFLSIVVALGEEIEQARLPITENVVYSYRFSPNYENFKLFNESYNWIRFQKDSLELVNSDSNINYIVICDIADFYNRVGHHPLDNSLDRINGSTEITSKLKTLIHKFTDSKSYGLPIGGDAARILAELALNNIDKQLYTKGYRFKRFVDDIHIFCKTLQEAHSVLNFLSVLLMRNEGLNLQKHKTQIQSRNEFQKLIASRINADSEDKSEAERVKFMSLPINYDPYSDSAEEDYQKIKKDLQEFDIVGLLNEELRKARIHQPFGKKLIKSLETLEPNVLSEAFKSIVEKYEVLYPIFPTIMITAYKCYDKLDLDAKQKLISSLQKLVLDDSYIVQSEINMVYLLRVLGLNNNLQNEIIIHKAYDRFYDSTLIKCVVMQIMTRWRAYHWLRDKKATFTNMSKWERRVFIIAANFLGDEGEHWLKFSKREFSEFETILMNWGKEKSSITNWEFPL